MKTLSIETTQGSMNLPKIILGSTMFGTGIDELTSFALMDLYTELGGFCIDTASVYGDWEDTGEPISELTIGKWLKQSPHRENMKIITKGGHFKINSPEISRVSPTCIEEDIQKSLKSLQVEAIDLYFLHRDNRNVPVEEIMPILHKYIEAGAIKAIGASNWELDRILEANTFAKGNDLTPFSASQIKWSLAFSTQGKSPLLVEENLPYMTDSVYDQYLEAGIPVLAWSSQASGIISKVVRSGWDSLDGKLRDEYYNDSTIHRIKNLQTLMAQKKISATQAALGYITCNPLPAAALIGTSNLNNLRDSMTAAHIELTIDEVGDLTG